ncbi:phosphate ABC transporter ATP-binding protein PstB [Lederbergia ruris]|uniref:phosphate ABC transporter ATP-binding protein PstB n=1 Tax=Lederbergia ruris TaxID=217495 RepID=UPI00399FDEE6
MVLSLHQQHHKETVMKAENLQFYYGEFQALKNINLEIKKNQITALIGPSGCGKSTFLRTLNRMNDFIPESRSEGKIYLHDLEITNPAVDVVDLRKKIGMVFQQANPFPVSIYDNIAYGPRIHGRKDKQFLDQTVESCLRSAALWDEVKDDLRAPATSLSGGQQQRLVIARVLAIQPDVILMDEPTSALDPLSTNKLESLILRLKEKYTIVIVTHNMQQAARVSDQTAFFLNGEIVEYGSTQRIFSNPQHEKTKQYIMGEFG